MENKQQAVSQQEVTVKTVQLQGKESSAFLVPDLQEGQVLAVVDEEVLRFLTELLPTASTREIIDAFIEKLRVIKARNDGMGDLKEAVAVAKHFVSFHTTVNLLDRYFDPKSTVVKEKPFNVAMTLDELVDKWQELEAQIAGQLDDMSPTDYYRDLVERRRQQQQKSEPTVVANH